MADFNANNSGSALRDSFDLYAAIADAASGPRPIWASSASWSLTDGRFGGSRALTSGTNSATLLDAASTGSNDGTILFRFAFEQVIALSGTNLGLGVQFLDGTSAQCTLIFQSNGSVLLKSGGAGGSTLATLASVFSQATWVSIQGEIKIHDSTGSIKLWTAGQTGDPAVVTADFSATGLNTRGGTANNYANNVRIVTGAGMSTIGSGNHRIDDFHVHNATGAAPNDLRGDLRAEVLRPSGDAAVQFAQTGSGKTLTQVPITGGSSDTGAQSSVVGRIIFNPLFAAPASGTLDHVVWTPNANHATAKVKMAIYEENASLLPGTKLGESAEITGWTGAQSFDFTGAGIAIVAGVKYWTAIIFDTAVTNVFGHSSQISNNSSQHPRLISSTYASFPSDGSSALDQNACPWATVVPVLAPISTNWGSVADAQQDGTASFVYSQTVGHVDLYDLDNLSSTPALIDAAVVCGFMGKSDAGSRSGQMEIDSGGTTDDSPAVPLSTTMGYLRETHTVDPHTAGQWSAAGVNALKAGPKVAA